jgi:putative FmdB family regulatory protein
MRRPRDDYGSSENASPGPLDPKGSTGESPFMPIYDYRCGGCGARFELLVRGEQQVTCPQCSGDNLERLMSLTARPATGGKPADYSRLGPPAGGGGCCGGGCGSHSH